MEGAAVDGEDDEHHRSGGGAPIVEIGGDGKALNDGAGIGEAIERQGDKTNHDSLKTTEPGIPAIDPFEMFCQQRPDQEEGCVVKGERGVDRGIAAAEMKNVGAEGRKRERSNGKNNGCEKHPYGAEAEHGQKEEGEDEGDTHLVDERPECGVELRPVVVAQEEDVLKDKAGGYG